MLFLMLKCCLLLGLHFIIISPTSGLHQRTMKPWPDATVYYEIGPSVPQDMEDLIKYAVKYLNSLTCVKWIKRDSRQNDVPNYLTFNHYEDSPTASVCQAALGFQGGQQEMRLGRNCWSHLFNLGNNYQRGTVIHEMMHTLGFHHEHQRPDRGCYIKVERPAEAVEILRPENEWVDDFPYDYQSVMHYGLDMGLEPLNKSISKIGSIDGTLSPTDIKKIESVYCGAPSFCEDPRNQPECRAIWKAKQNTKCSDWSGWINFKI